MTEDPDLALVRSVAEKAGLTYSEDVVNDYVEARLLKAGITEAMVRARTYDQARMAMAGALGCVVSPSPDSAEPMRARGWAVAVHNDYRLNGIRHTFWLFTKGDACVKGEGLTDAEAIACALAEASRVSP